MKYVFVDLDEVLIHTSYFYGAEPGSGIVEGFAEYYSDPYLYVAQVRPGAHELLTKIREIVPTSRVFMLTTSVEDYAKHWNKVFNFGFHTIYHRSDIENCSVEPLDPVHFPDAEVYHIDNLPRGENGGKIGFLKAIDPNPTYIQVSEFFRSPDHDFTVQEINEVLIHITSPHRADRWVPSR